MGMTIAGAVPLVPPKGRVKKHRGTTAIRRDGRPAVRHAPLVTAVAGMPAPSPPPPTVAPVADQRDAAVRTAAAALPAPAAAAAAAPTAAAAAADVVVAAAAIGVGTTPDEAPPDDDEAPPDDDEVSSDVVVAPPEEDEAPPDDGTSLPRVVPLSVLYAGTPFPPGQLMHYTDANAYRTSDEELSYRDRLSAPLLERLRHASEAHRRVRRAMAPHIRPGVTTLSIVERLESLTRAHIGTDGLAGGCAFPTGISLNEVAAHDTPNPGDPPRVVTATDVVKVDFGTHVAGRIIDSAWTVGGGARAAPLLSAVRAATEAGVAAAGIDVRLADIGAAVQEVMESYEVDTPAGPVPVKSVRNLGGHSIELYRIHGGKVVPGVRTAGCSLTAGGVGGRRRRARTVMEEGEVYAIETFGTTGRGVVEELPAVSTSHYMRASKAQMGTAVQLRSRSSSSSPMSTAASTLLSTINARHGTLAFCRRWLDRAGATDHAPALAELVALGVVEEYPPLADVRGSLTAQFEHTLVLRPCVKEVLSRGDDY
ncbi:hypothetical protein MMPV_007780 [Pyropia vietnamensis]